MGRNYKNNAFLRNHCSISVASKFTALKLWVTIARSKSSKSKSTRGLWVLFVVSSVCFRFDLSWAVHSIFTGSGNAGNWNYWYWILRRSETENWIVNKRVKNSASPYGAGSFGKETKLGSLTGNSFEFLKKGKVVNQWPLAIVFWICPLRQFHHHATIEITTLSIDLKWQFSHSHFDGSTFIQKLGFFQENLRTWLTSCMMKSWWEIRILGCLSGSVWIGNGGYGMRRVCRHL